MSVPELIQALQNSVLYPHPVTTFKVIETHISWVILTGAYAYKIKKPVDFGVLDFSSLAQRRHFCNEELRLNKLVAPKLYDSVVAITGTPAAPQFNGAGTVIEYAIKMREFSQETILTHVIAHAVLTRAAVQQLATVVADFHLTTVRAPADTDYGTPAQVQLPVVQNFTQIFAWLRTPADLAIIAQLQAWAATQYQQLLPLLTARQRAGFIRDCHGDLHLGNIIWDADRIILFDRLEFNPALRWIDVLADFAFLWMDLIHKRQHALAHDLRNQYLATTGDYAGLAVLPYYTAYRAMVRAKVTLFQATQLEATPEQATALRADYASYIALAQACQFASAPVLIITYGLSGAGKSTLAQFFVEQVGAIQLSSDLERKRLAGSAAPANAQKALAADFYSAANTATVYARLLELARGVLEAGYPVIVDATFLKQAQRAAFAALAECSKVPFGILQLTITRPLALVRLAQRSAAKTSISDADISVFDHQTEIIEPLTVQEQQRALRVVDAVLDSDRLATWYAALSAQAK